MSGRYTFDMEFGIKQTAIRHTNQKMRRWFIFINIWNHINHSSPFKYARESLRPKSQDQSWTPNLASDQLRGGGIWASFFWASVSSSLRWKSYFIAHKGVVRKKMRWYIWECYVHGKSLNRNKDRYSYLCSALGARKVASGRSWDGESGVLLGKWVWALDSRRPCKFPGGAACEDAGMWTPEKQMVCAS